MRTSLLVVGICVSVLAAYVYAQAPAPSECTGRNWSRFSVQARLGADSSWQTDGGARNATFCLGGALVTADEMRVVSTDGRRTYELLGHVTLTMPEK